LLTYQEKKAIAIRTNAKKGTILEDTNGGFCDFATLSSRVQFNTVSTLAQPSPPTAGIPNLPWPPCSIIDRDQEILQKKKG
jgi:hypothetical protein